MKQLSQYCKYEKFYGGLIVNLNQIRKYPLNSISNISEEISKLPRYENYLEDNGSVEWLLRER